MYEIGVKALEIEVVWNILSIVLFLGFGMADFVAFSTIDKQKEITVYSRYGRNTGPLEILYVNFALLSVAGMLYYHSYRFFPAVTAFILLIFLNSRMQSGIAPIGVFIGTTYLEWGKIHAYQIVNDEISTVRVQAFAGKKCYILRCRKEYRSRIEAYFNEHNIPLRSEKEEEE